MTTPRSTNSATIPDEVIGQIKAESKAYRAEQIKSDPQNYGKKSKPVDDFDEAYSKGAQAFYLKGCDDMAKRIVEWLRSDSTLVFGDNADVFMNSSEWADEIEAKFLKDE